MLGALSGIAGCGFTPSYAPGGGGSALQGQILVDEPKEWSEFMLTENLEEKFGRASAPVYGLSYSIDIEDDEVSITDEDVTQRYNKVADVTYALRDLKTGEVKTSGKISSFTGYSGTGTTVANVAAERDATKRLMQIISDQIAVRLIAVAPEFQE